jgi:hypothetical protein
MTTASKVGPNRKLPTSCPGERDLGGGGHCDPSCPRSRVRLAAPPSPFRHPPSPRGRGDGCDGATKPPHRRVRGREFSRKPGGANWNHIGGHTLSVRPGV